MDLNELVPSERIVEILSPGKKQPIGVRVMLLHVDDERLTKLKRRIQDERIRLEQKGKFFKADDLEENANELTFAAMTGWEWYNLTGGEKDKGYDPNGQAKFNGEIPEFNKKNVFEIFKKLPWFREQIGREMGDDEAFFPN